MKVRVESSPPSSDSRPTLDVPVIDGLRGLAILWIVVGHCWSVGGSRVPVDGGPILYIIRSFAFGVNLLFIVSGFVLFLPVVVDGSIGNLRSYFARRAARIVPGFYVALAFTFLVAVSLGVWKGGLGSWIAHLTFLHAEAVNFDDVGFGVNRAMWTMSVEVMFYALLPLVASWFRKHPLGGLAIAIAVGELWKLAIVHLDTIFPFVGITPVDTADARFRMAIALPTFAADFAFGMTAAWVYVRFREKNTPAHRSLASAATLASLIGLIAITHISGATSSAADERFAPWIHSIDRVFFFAVLVLGTALAGHRVQWLFKNSWMRVIGVASFGIYLTHQPLIRLLLPRLGFAHGVPNNVAFVTLLIIVLPLSIWIAILSYTSLEEPFRRWARSRRTSGARAGRTSPLPPPVDAMTGGAAALGAGLGSRSR